MISFERCAAWALHQQGEAAEARRALVQAQPQSALSARHVAGAVLLPDRLALLDWLPPGGEAAEIGVDHGDFAAEILARTRPRRLHLVDAWDEARFARGRTRVEARFAPDIAAGRVALHVGASLPVLAGFPPAALDWLYLDTDHSYATTAAELRLAARALRPGGVLTGHDYCAGNVVGPVPYGVIAAVHEFCVEEDWRFAALALDGRGHLSFALRQRPS